VNIIDCIQATDLITAVSGVTFGVRWTIEHECVRRPAYRLHIDGKYVLTLDSPGEARWWRDQFVEQAAADVRTTVQAARGNPEYSAELLEEVERRLNRKADTAPTVSALV